MLYSGGRPRLALEGGTMFANKPVGVVLLLLLVGTGYRASAAEPPARKEVVAKGLAWLTGAQQADGHWDTRGSYSTAMTSLAGLALLMEGSTTSQGKYADNLRRAVDWLC